MSEFTVFCTCGKRYDIKADLQFCAHQSNHALQTEHIAYVEKMVKTECICKTTPECGIIHAIEIGNEFYCYNCRLQITGKDKPEPTIKECSEVEYKNVFLLDPEGYQRMQKDKYRCERCKLMVTSPHECVQIDFDQFMCDKLTNHCKACNRECDTFEGLCNSCRKLRNEIKKEFEKSGAFGKLKPVDEKLPNSVIKASQDFFQPVIDSITEKTNGHRKLKPVNENCLEHPVIVWGEDYTNTRVRILKGIGKEKFICLMQENKLFAWKNIERIPDHDYGDGGNYE